MSSFWNDIKYSFNVSVPPNPVVIFDETGTRRTTFVGPYLTGDSMTLVCDAFGGKRDNTKYIIASKIYIHILIFP